MLQCPKILLEWCILCDFVTANVKKVAWKKMMAVQPQRATKKQFKILRCEKCAPNVYPTTTAAGVSSG